jgi:hypothetical protein
MEGDKESLKWMENNKSLSTKRIMEKFCCTDDAERGGAGVEREKEGETGREGARERRRENVILDRV